MILLVYHNIKTHLIVIHFRTFFYTGCYTLKWQSIYYFAYDILLGSRSCSDTKDNRRTKRDLEENVLEQVDRLENEIITETENELSKLTTDNKDQNIQKVPGEDAQVDRLENEFLTETVNELSKLATDDKDHNME